MKNLPIVRDAKAGHPLSRPDALWPHSYWTKHSKDREDDFLGSLGRNSVGNC